MVDKGISITIAYYDYGYSDGENSNHHLKSDYIKLLPLKKNSIITMLKNFLIKRKFSLQECLFYSYRQSKVIQQELSANKYDIILVDMIRMAPLVENINFPVKLIEYDDLLSSRYSRMREVKTDEFNLLGTYSNKFPIIFSRFAVSLKNFLLKYEGKKILSRENMLSKKFDRISFTSRLEADEFKLRINYNKRVYDNPPSIKACPTVTSASAVGSADFIFIGNLKSNHNLACLDNLTRIFKDARLINVRLKVYGDYDERAIKTCENQENILLCGKIINLSEKLQQAKCLIAPFSFGTGIKIKIIEAMQYKTLVITNSIGAEGIPISSDIHFINCSTDEEYISNILKINSYNKNDKFITDITSAANNLIQEKFADNIVSDNFMKFLRGDDEK
ncbi:hypothetical protein ABW13_16415 [Pluralibacter gergoviae]|nr:hypothetical protein ABW13_16415 [Pluralibacter gergoviae]